MDRIESLDHSKWECKYHVVFIPKRRRKTLYGAVRPHLVIGYIKGKSAIHPPAGRRGSPVRPDEPVETMSAHR